MATIAQLRVVSHDGEKIRSDEVVGVGDGTRTKWVLEMHPIKNASETLTVGGVSSTNYSVDTNTGLVVFDSAPADEAEILATTYSYYALSDADLTTILGVDGNFFRAWANVLRVLASDAAKFFAWSSGDEKVDKSKVCANFLKLAENLDKRATSSPASGMEFWKTEEEDYGGLLDIDETDYLDESV